MRLPKGLVRVWHMAQGGVEDDEVEGRIRELEASTVARVVTSSKTRLPKRYHGED